MTRDDEIGASTSWKASVILAHGIIGWAYCGLLIAVGRRFLSMETTLALHAIGAPLGFALIAYFYFRRFADTGPLQTAAALTGIVLALDLNRSGEPCRLACVARPVATAQDPRSDKHLGQDQRTRSNLHQVATR